MSGSFVSRSRHLFLVGAAGVAAVVGGVLVVPAPWIVLSVFVGLPSLAVIVNSSRARLYFFVLGGLAVFQLPDSASSIKLAYLGGVALCSAVSVTRVSRVSDPWVRSFWPLIPPGALAVLVFAIGLTIGITQSDPTDAVRDAIPYLLLVLGPVIGLDAARDMGTRGLYRLTVSVGIAAAVGFSTDWLERRGVSSLPFGRFLLATFMLGALGFVVALVMASSTIGWSRLRWIVAACVIPSAYLITGSRGVLVIFAGAIGMMGSSRKSRAPIARAFSLVVAVAVTIYVVVPPLAQVLISDPSFIDGRIRAATQFLDGSGGDQSLQERLQAVAWTNDAFQANLLFGTGPGHRYPNGAFTLDSPLTLLAKWGLIGGLAFVGFLVAIALVSRNVHLAGTFTPANAVARGFLFVVLAITPFGGAFEDKGFALAVALLIAILAASAREVAQLDELQTPNAGAFLEGDSAQN